MMWQEEEDKDPTRKIPEDVVDLTFSMKCPQLPVDHASMVAEAILEHLPWFRNDPRSGLHTIHTADSGNGWTRPENGDAILYPSRRTPFIIRIPHSRIEDARKLEGKTLNLEDHAITLSSAKVRLLSNTTALYSRGLLMIEGESEAVFIERAVDGLNQLGVRFKKILAGKSHRIRTPSRTREVRSLFIADLAFLDAIKLQEFGLGDAQWMGCGVFIPHKTLKNDG